MKSKKERNRKYERIKKGGKAEGNEVDFQREKQSRMH